MRVVFSEPFARYYKRIKDSRIRDRIITALKKIAQKPEAGKPLRYAYKGNSRLVVRSFRLLYRIEGGVIRITNFEHRKKAYKR